MAPAMGSNADGTSTGEVTDSVDPIVVFGDHDGHLWEAVLQPLRSLAAAHQADRRDRMV